MKAPLPILVAVLALSARAAGPPDHYLDLQFTDGGGGARVNGFPLFAGGVTSTGFSTWLTPYLKSGENRVTLHFHTPPERSNARMEFSVVSHPHDGKQRTDAGETVLASADVSPRRVAWLTEIPDEVLEVLAGSRDVDGSLVFAPAEDGRVAFGARLARPEDQLRGRPEGLDYVALSHALTEVEVHFSHTGGPARVSFEKLSLPPGIGEIPLPITSLASGIEWLDGERFDTLWISGKPLDPLEENEAVTATSWKFHSVEPDIEITRRFTIDGLPEWAWQRGADAAEALADPARRAALVEHLREIHRVIDTRPAAEWTPLFTHKTRAYAVGMHEEPEAMRESQREFFESLANLEGWGLVPFQPERLRLVAVNDTVVRARYIDREGPVVSHPVVKPDGRRPERFSIPLYLALIDGEWSIVL